MTGAEVPGRGRTVTVARAGRRGAAAAPAAAGAGATPSLVTMRIAGNLKPLRLSQVQLDVTGLASSRQAVTESQAEFTEAAPDGRARYRDESSQVEPHGQAATDCPGPASLMMPVIESQSH